MPLAHTAFLFPGQASQYVGMGRQVLESRPDMGVYFDIASDILHQDVRKLMFEGPLETLTQTEYAQPAILLASYISYKLFNQVPETAAGHSLGEFSALCAAGALCFADAVELVNKRGKYMHPEAFGLPETMATDYSEERERGKQVLRETFRKGR